MASGHRSGVLCASTSSPVVIVMVYNVSVHRRQWSSLWCTKYQYIVDSGQRSGVNLPVHCGQWSSQWCTKYLYIVVSGHRSGVNLPIVASGHCNGYATCTTCTLWPVVIVVVYKVPYIVVSGHRSGVQSTCTSSSVVIVVV